MTCGTGPLIFGGWVQSLFGAQSPFGAKAAQTDRQDWMFLKILAEKNKINILKNFGGKHKINGFQKF